MKKLLTLFALVVFAFTKANAQNEIVYNAVPVNYKTYCNSKFAFCVKYPEAFTTEGENEAGDGQLFAGVDGAVIEVQATLNTEKLTVKKAYADALKTYNDATEDAPTVVVDLLEKDRYLIIAKDEIALTAKLAVLTGDHWKTVTITIPKKRETYYKDKIDEIFRTFNAHTATGLLNLQNAARK